MDQAHKLGWTLEDLRRRWAELEAAGWCRAEWSSDVVYLPGLFGEGKPENPKVVIGWSTPLADVPECPLRAEACKEIVARCLARAEECVAGSDAKDKTRDDWRKAIARTFGPAHEPARHAARADDTAKGCATPPESHQTADAPSDGAVDTVSDTVWHTVSDTVWHTRNRSRNRTRTPPPNPSGGN